ncbi:hypothetical protein BOW87_gp162 [Synechococcus phage S-CAM3]|nr:hypothetical protein BOW87_gp162 [Synechococcus phage S-CAM3]AOV59079.1 hypothetical protein C421010_096 [Synechococcus phage S-CAM3]
MFLSDFYRASDTVTTTGKGSDDLGNDFFIHALDRDEKGMLKYTKIRSINPTEIADFTRKDGTPYLDIATGLYDYVEETTEEKSLYNSSQDRYQQFRFDARKLSYFIDDEGYFVLRFNEDYDYTTNGPK